LDEQSSFPSVDSSTVNVELNSCSTRTDSSIPGERIETPNLFYLEMPEVPDEEVSIYSDCHEPGNRLAEKAEFRQSLKRKAANQHLSAMQNLLAEALSDCTADLNVELPKLESHTRVDG
jgi:hypothetical protein